MADEIHSVKGLQRRVSTRKRRSLIQGPETTTKKLKDGASEWDQPQTEEECNEDSPGGSPLPPTPQTSRYQQSQSLIVSARPRATSLAPEPSKHQAKEVPVEWDDEDSFYDKLDMDQLIAESQEAERVNPAGPIPSTTSSSSSSSSTSSASAVGRRKCSMTTTSLLPNGHGITAERSMTRNDREVLPQRSVSSETPRPEKWFSSIEGQSSGEPSRHSGFFLEEASSAPDPRLRPGEAGPRSAESEKAGTLHCQGKTPVGSVNPNDKAPGKATVQSVTPAVRSAAGRLRQRLQANAREATPTSARLAELRQARVQEALTKALEEAEGASDNDVGPFYGLPSRVAELLRDNRGIDKLYDWQHACLTLPAIREGRNLIYSLPTSGGKTLVAEILIMRQLLCNRKDALLILPYVSIVQEKVATLSTFAVELGFLVEEYAGSKGAIPPRKRRKKTTLYIATIERAHSLVNCLILEGRVESLGLVVVDELHMLGDGGRRGACLEACVAKLLHLNSAHLVGMSATLSNVHDLCRFMRAELYCSDFRPVELKEYIKIEDNIFEVNQAALCPDDRFTHSRIITFPYSRTLRQQDPDHLVGLALEVIPVHSCLVFCATKKSCQNVAEFICKHMPKEEARTLMQHRHRGKQALLTSLRQECQDHLCPTLRRTVPYGLAYHHGGLTADERKLIEDAYAEGTLCLLTCTSTLAAGVNLPAKRVILRSPYIAQDLLTSTRYKQMVGRAGRAGIDSSGESILIIKAKQRREIAELLSRPVEACYSSLTHDGGKGIRSLLLTIIALKLTPHRQAVQGFMEQTLFGIQASTTTGSDIQELTAKGLRQLLDLKLIGERQTTPPLSASDGPELVVTPLGQAAFKGSIDIDLCASIYSDLKQACDRGLILADSLHLLYLVTPYDLVASSNPNWVIYDRLYSHLCEGDLLVAELVGVTDRYLNFKVAGRKFKKPDEALDFRVRRFYLTLMLWKLLNQTGVWEVAAKFEVPRGFVQGLFTAAASFGSSVQRFCQDLPEFWAYQHLLTKVVHDLTYCATADLVSLLEVPGVKQGRAKQLVRAGYKTLRHLAHADPEQLTRDVEHLPKKVAKQIVAAAKMELAERAEALREEAEELVTKPLLEEEAIAPQTENKTSEQTG